MRAGKALALAAVPLLLAGTAGVAYADNVTNDVTAGGNDTITAGGSTTINYKIVATNGADGQSGCNAGDSTPATLSLSVPSGVTASATSLTFTSCGTTQSVTYSTGSSLSAGNYPITTAVHDSGVGTYNDNADFTLHVNAPIPTDTTAPSIGYTLNPSTPNGSNDWYTSDVSLAWTVTENESPGSLVKTGCDDQNITSDQQATTYSCSAKSDGGSADPVNVSIKRDATAPTNITFSGVQDYTFGDAQSTPSCNADDATSGLDTCVVTGGGTSTGSQTWTATATDNAGNVSHDTATYTVNPWNLKGFYQPVDMSGIVNTVKGGSTVPLKFEMFAGTRELTDVGDVASFKTALVSCASISQDPTDAIEMVTTGGTSLRYDSTAGQFVQNWKTPTGANTCYQAIMTADDGTALKAFFKITK